MGNDSYNFSCTSWDGRPVGGVVDLLLIDKVKLDLLVISIFFDLIAGVIASLFTYQIYQGVEISHPVYCVVFSNNLLANALSFLIFVLAIIKQFMECCICDYLVEVILSCVFFMNCICWTIVAFLRYTLLISKKVGNDSFYGETGMIRLTKVALLWYWGLLILLCAIRSTLIYISNRFGIPVIRWSGTLSIILALTLITIIVYYVLDVTLESIENLANTKDKKEDEEVLASEVVVSSNEAQRNTPTSSIELRTRSLNENWSNRVINIPKGTSRHHVTNVASLKLKISRSMSSAAQTPAHLQHTDEKPYGGIYVGEGEISNKLDVPDIMSLQEEKGSCTKIGDGETPSDSKLLQPSCSFFDASLPNEVIDKEIHILNTSSIHGNHPKPRSHVKDVKTSTHNITAFEKNNYDDRIVVDQDWFEEERRDPGEDETEARDVPEEKSDSERNAYRNSKEHHSIKKAYFVNWLFLGFLIISISISIVVFKIRREKGILLFKAMLSLYKTITPIISSIYCFDVIHCLFQQMSENVIDDLYNVYDMARRALL